MSEWVNKRIKFWYQINPVGVLNEYCQKNKLKGEPNYYFIRQKGKFPVCDTEPTPEFAVRCTVKIEHLKYMDFGFGNSKKEAKRHVASQILHSMSLHDTYLEQMVTACLKKDEKI